MPKTQLRPAEAPLTIEWLTSPGQMESISDEWRELEQAVQNRTALSTFDFLATWYRHYAGDYGGALRIGLARRGSRLVGVAPLTLRRGSIARVPVTRVDFAPNDSPVGAFLVEDDHPEIVTALLQSLVQTEKVDVVCLNGFDPGSAHLTMLQEAAPTLGLTVALEDEASAVADLRGGYQAYRATLSGHFRRNLNARARKIAAAGRTSIEGVVLSDGVETTEKSIARMIAITEASYKLQGRRLGDNHRDYLYELGKRFGPRGMLSLTFLTIDGEDAAYLFGLVERGCFYDINLSYDERFEKLSPGTFLTQKTMEMLEAKGIHTVVSHGAHEYKKFWATEFVPEKRVFLFASSVKGTAARLVRFSLAPLWRRLAASASARSDGASARPVAA
ncbi:MAG TPA: GNAT family N-acetyltransferase [Terriglobia bacterium]|nr:GNAT family N-acetyltransferase [Terriglobia bacterium]